MRNIIEASAHDLTAEYYTPSALGEGAEPSLPANGSLTMGYGDGGGRPFTYFLHPYQSMDVGFIKIFVSTKFVDLSAVEQRSPFESEGSRASHQQLPSRKLQEDGWDTILIAVNQHRSTPSVSDIIPCV